MLTIALTGGIASGKSTVADLFAEFGIPIIDADKIAREVVEPGTPGLAALVDHFGAGILLPDKTLNRTKLREIVFSEPAEKTFLEQTLHPLIRQESDSRRDEYSKTGVAYCIYDIPLLVETAQQHRFDRVLVVDVSEDIQATRVMARDNISRDSAMKIVRSQATRQQRLDAATDVIKNDIMLDALASEVKALHEKFLSFAKA